MLARKLPGFLDRVIEVISHLVQEPYAGLHKPKPLRGGLSGAWSVRPGYKDRLIYKVAGERILALSLEGHYDDT